MTPSSASPAQTPTSPSRRDSRIYALVMAAGRASRFGMTKQLALYRGECLVAHAMRRAEELCGDRSVLVTGYDGQAVHAACAPLSGFLVHNDKYAEGLGGSIALGVAAVAGAADAVLLLLADQPLVTVAHLEQLIATWRDEPGRAVASRYAGIAGVPAIFPPRDFAALSALSGDRGAQSILKAYGDELRVVDFEGAGVDIDKPADLAALAKPDQP